MLHCQSLADPHDLLVEMVAHETSELDAILAYSRMSAFHVQKVDLVVFALQARM
jgi:hypothetical protein